MCMLQLFEGRYVLIDRRGSKFRTILQKGYIDNTQSTNMEYGTLIMGLSLGNLSQPVFTLTYLIRIPGVTHMTLTS